MRSAASARKLLSALWQLNKGDGGEAVARRSWSWIPADGDGLGGGEADREGKRASESDGKAEG